MPDGSFLLGTCMLVLYIYVCTYIYTSPVRYRYMFVSYNPFFQVNLFTGKEVHRLPWCVAFGPVAAPSGRMVPLKLQHLHRVLVRR